jgi:hypothetical protein
MNETDIYFRRLLNLTLWGEICLPTGLAQQVDQLEDHLEVH